MRDLAATLAPVEVEVSGLPGLHLVRRPTLREALAVLAAAEAMGEGDASAWPEVRRVAGVWLGLRLASILAGGGPAQALPALVRLLSVGLREPERHAADAGAVQAKARRAGFFEVLAEHATAYRMSPEQVLETPWPFFVAMHAEIDRQRAREQFRQAEWYASAKTGRLDGIMGRMGYEAPPPEVPDSMDDEWYERQMAAARRWRDRHKQEQARA